MGTISLRLPESLPKQVRELANQDGISISQFTATALAEKMSALMTADYLERRTSSGSREKFEHALAKVTDVKPAEQDRL